MPSDKTFEEYSLPVYRGQSYTLEEPPADLESYIEERQLFDLDFVSTLALLGISNIMIVRMACIDYPMRGKMLKTFYDMVKVDGAQMVSRGLPAILMCHAVLIFTLETGEWMKRYIKYQEYAKMKVVPTDQRLEELVSQAP